MELAAPEADAEQAPAPHPSAVAVPIDDRHLAVIVQAFDDIAIENEDEVLDHFGLLGVGVEVAGAGLGGLEAAAACAPALLGAVEELIGGDVLAFRVRVDGREDDGHRSGARLFTRVYLDPFPILGQSFVVRLEDLEGDLRERSGRLLEDGENASVPLDLERFRVRLSDPIEKSVELGVESGEAVSGDGLPGFRGHVVQFLPVLESMK